MKKAKDYAFSTVVDTSYEEAVPKIIEVLEDEGFGVLTKIDVKSTLKKKLDVDFRKYLILGACNPPYAYRALQAEIDVGLLLPCNVIIYETDERKVHVSALNPMTALGVIKNEELKEIALEVSERLKRVIHRVAESEWLGFYKIDPAIQSLVTNLSSNDDIARVHSRESLVKIGKPAIPQLIEALKHGGHWLRWEAAKTLTQIGDPSAAPALVEALKDEEFDIRWLAAEGLLKIKKRGIEPLLHALMAQADLPRLLEGGHHVIRELVKTELKEYLTPVLSALEGMEPSLQVPWAARTAHEKLIEDRVIPSHYKPILKEAKGS
jgi:uncharacterized protein (DUF302 family)